jgi:aspartate/methionine/tyrosine aminotransferase
MRTVQAPIIPTVGHWIREHPGTVSLAQGVVFYPPPPAALLAAERYLQHGQHKYGAVQGLASLRAAIAAKLKCENGIAVDEDTGRIIVTAGGNMAFLNAMFAICDVGDEVILPLPYYFNHEMAIRMVGAQAVLVPTTADLLLDRDALRAAITTRTRAIVTVSPNNPSGMVYSREQLAAVNAMCRDHGIYHISDEAYEHFTYGDSTHFSPGSLPGSDAYTISIFSLSKSYGFAAWRIGYMVLPEHLVGAVMKAQDTNLICANLMAQEAAAAMIEAGTPYREEKRRTLSGVRDVVMSALKTLGDSCRISASTGALYIFARLDTPLDPLVLTQRLIREHGVAVLPGSAFGIEEGCTIRVSYGALEPDSAIAGVKRLVTGLDALLHGGE